MSDAEISKEFDVFRESLISQIKEFEKSHDCKVVALRGNQFAMHKMINPENNLCTKL